MLSFLKQSALEPTWNTSYLGRVLGVDAQTAKRIAAELAAVGYIEPIPSKADTWHNTEAGDTVAGAKEPRLIRATADKAVRDFLDRINQVNADESSPVRIAKAIAFGGYTTEHQRIQDVEVAVALAQASVGDYAGPEARNAAIPKRAWPRIEGGSAHGLDADCAGTGAVNKDFRPCARLMWLKRSHSIRYRRHTRARECQALHWLKVRGCSVGRTYAEPAGTILSSPIVSMLLLAALTVLVIGVLSYQADSARALANSQISRVRLVEDGMSALLSNLKDAETGQRGYLLTGRAEYLEPNYAALGALPGIRRQLRAAISGRPEEKQLRGLEAIVDAKLRELAATVELRRLRGLSSAQEIVETGSGRALMDAIRTRCATIGERTESRLAEPSATAENLIHRVRLVSIGGSRFLMALLALASAIIVRGLSHRERLYYEATASREVLKVTLSSIGDAADTRVTFINPVAEKLTGWGEREALNVPINRVLNIINEVTRAPVDNPLQRVLTDRAILEEFRYRIRVDLVQSRTTESEDGQHCTNR